MPWSWRWPRTRVEGLLGVEAAIHGDEIVRHEEQANRRIGREPIDERLAGHGLDRADEVGERRPVDRVDALQQLGELGAHRRVRMRLQLGDEPLHLFEDVARLAHGASTFTRRAAAQRCAGEPGDGAIVRGQRPHERAHGVELRARRRR